MKKIKITCDYCGSTMGYVSTDDESLEDGYDFCDLTCFVMSGLIGLEDAELANQD